MHITSDSTRYDFNNVKRRKMQSNRAIASPSFVNSLNNIFFTQCYCHAICLLERFLTCNKFKIVVGFQQTDIKRD